MPNGQDDITKEVEEIYERRRKVAGVKQPPTPEIPVTPKREAPAYEPSPLWGLPEGRSPIQVQDLDTNEIRTLTIDKTNTIWDEANRPVAQFNPETQEFTELWEQPPTYEPSPITEVEPRRPLWQEILERPWEMTMETFGAGISTAIPQAWKERGLPPLPEEFDRELQEKYGWGTTAYIRAKREKMAELGMELPQVPVTPEELTVEYKAKFPNEWVRLGIESGPLMVLPAPTFSTIAGKLATKPAYISWLAKLIWPAVKLETAPAQITAKISQKQTERVLLNLLKRMPTDDELKATLTNEWYKKVVKELSAVPGVKGIVKRIDPTAVAESETQKALLRRLALLEITENKGNAIMSLLYRYGDDIALFGVDERGICTRVIAKAKYKGKVPALGDVLERPYMWRLTKRQADYIKTLHRMNDTVRDMLKAENISVREIDFEEGAHWVHRHVIGKEAGHGEIGLFRQGGKAIGAKKPFEKTRFYDFMAEGINNNVVYGKSANEYFRTYYDGAMRMIADKRLATMIPGKTILQRMPMAIRQEAIANAQEFRNYKKLVSGLNRMATGWRPAPITLKGIDRWDAGIGRKLRDILKLKGRQREKQLWGLVKKAKVKLTNAERRHNISRIAYRKAKGRATVLSPTEAYIGQPAFAGRIFPKETADVINKFYGETASGWLKAMSNFSAASRTLVATADTSAPLIQGLPVLGHSPHIWAKATGIQFATFADKKVASNFLMKHGVTVQEMAQHKVIVMGTQNMHEMVAALPMLQRLVAKAPGKLGPALEKAFANVYGRFGVAFTSFGDVSRVMLWESMRDSWARKGQLNELARLINHMTGVMSTRAIGVPQSQMAIENAFIFFAPRYTRAGLALFGDIFTGGYTTREALRAIAGFLAGGTAFYLGTCAALGQEPNLDVTATGRAFTIKVGNQHLGIGGFMYATVRGLADIYASVAEMGDNELVDFVKFDPYENPIFRFWYNRRAQATELISGLVTREDFLGHKLETFEDWGRFIADFAIPIALQTVTTQEEKANWQALLVEMQGGRTFPESVWEKVNELRNKISQEEYGVKWEELDLHQKRMLEKLNPRIRQLALEARAKYAQWYPDEPRVKYQIEMDDADALYSDQLWQSAKAIELGIITTKEFTDQIDNFGFEHATRTDEIRNHYPEAMAEFEKWRLREREDYLLFDQAYDDYIQSIVLPSWQDEYYRFQWDAYRAEVQAYINKWGEKTYEEVRETLWLDDDFPPLFFELKASRELWREYYELPEKAIRREQYRLSNPEVDAALFFWGRVTTLKSGEAKILADALIEKYNVDWKAIPARQKIKGAEERALAFGPAVAYSYMSPELKQALASWFDNNDATQLRKLESQLEGIRKKLKIRKSYADWLETDLRDYYLAQRS